MNKLYIDVAAAARRTWRVKETCDVYLHNQVSTYENTFLHCELGLPDGQLLQQGRLNDLLHGGCMITHYWPIPKHPVSRSPCGKASKVHKQ